MFTVWSSDLVPQTVKIMEDREENQQHHHMTNVLSVINSAGAQRLFGWRRKVMGSTENCVGDSSWRSHKEAQGSSCARRRWHEPDDKSKGEEMLHEKTDTYMKISFYYLHRGGDVGWLVGQVVMKTGGRMRNGLRRDPFHHDADQESGIHLCVSDPQCPSSLPPSHTSPNTSAHWNKTDCDLLPAALRHNILFLLVLMAWRAALRRCHSAPCVYLRDAR